MTNADDTPVYPDTPTQRWLAARKVSRSVRELIADRDLAEFWLDCQDSDCMEFLMHVADVRGWWSAVAPAREAYCKAADPIYEDCERLTAGARAAFDEKAGRAWNHYVAAAELERTGDIGPAPSAWETLNKARKAARNEYMSATLQERMDCDEAIAPVQAIYADAIRAIYPTCPVQIPEEPAP